MKKSGKQGPTRRTFLKSTAGAGLAAATFSGAASAGSAQNLAPSDRIGIATIGLGQQGTKNTESALRLPGVEMVGVADLYQGRRERAAELFGKATVLTADYRELLSRSDIDAVIVATSDHWHTQICVEAMEAGKDVYCEKPMVQKIEEGPRMIEAQRRTGRILQVGSQRTSSVTTHKARELLLGGAIGELLQVEGWYQRSSSNGAWQYVIPPDASPRTVDWKRFLGNAPERPFDADRFFRWRSYWDYGTGIPGDLFVHLFTGLHYITDRLGPVRISADGGLRFWKDGREVPDMIAALYEYPATSKYPGFNLILKVNFADQVEDSGFRFVGSEGVMTVGRAISVIRQPRLYDIEPSISTFPLAMQKQLLRQNRKEHPEIYSDLKQEKVESFSAPVGYNGQDEHFRVFLEGVRSRKPVLQDAGYGFRAAGPALATNISYRENRPVEWDPEAMTLTS